MSQLDAKPAETAEFKATPIFGAGSSFNTGSGFGGFTAVPSTASAAASSSDAAAAAGGAEGEEEGAAPEEECQAEFKPVVQLEEVETSTGEEDETALIELKCKLYRFETGTNEWKERGVGQVKLLQNKDSKKIRLLMRQEKTLKIRANHIVMPGSKLQEHTGSDKAWVWTAVDFAEEEQKVELFCIRFGSVEKAQDFKKKYYEAVQTNSELISLPAGDEGEGEEEEDGEEAAEATDAKTAADVDSLAAQVQATKVE